MSQFPARRHFPRFIRPRERGAEQEGHQDRAAEAGPDRGGTSRVQRASHFGDPFSRANNRPQEEPIASSFPSVMRGLKPNPFGRQRLRSTNFPFGQSRIPRETNSPTFAVLRMRCGPSGAGRPGRAFLCRTEGNALAMGQRPPAPEKGSPKWPPTAPSPPPSVRPARP